MCGICRLEMLRIMSEVWMVRTLSMGRIFDGDGAKVGGAGTGKLSLYRVRVEWVIMSFWRKPVKHGQ